MSRTLRRTAGAAGRKDRREGAGRRSFVHAISRDNAATGLRDHKRERAWARQLLAEQPEREDLRNGKTRKYQAKRGEYLL